MEYQSWSPSGNPGVLGFQDWLKHTLAVIVQAAKSYLETEHETAFRFSPQMFTLQLSKNYFRFENVLFLCYFTLHSLAYFFMNYIWEGKRHREHLREELRKHNPDSNRAEQSACPDRKLWAAYCTNPSLLLFRFGANISGRDSYHYSHVTQSEYIRFLKGAIARDLLLKLNIFAALGMELEPCWASGIPLSHSAGWKVKYAHISNS